MRKKQRVIKAEVTGWQMETNKSNIRKKQKRALSKKIRKAWKRRGKMNKAEKSLRWVVNQIPDFKPTTNEEKMLVAIKLYSEAGADEIKRLEAENAELRERLEKAVELPVNIGDKVYMPWVYGGESGIAECEVYHISLFKDRNDGVLIVTDLKSDNIDFKREYNYGQFMLRDFGVKFFTAREAAEARLAELKGGAK